MRAAAALQALADQWQEQCVAQTVGTAVCARAGRSDTLMTADVAAGVATGVARCAAGGTPPGGTNCKLLVPKCNLLEPHAARLRAAGGT